MNTKAKKKEEAKENVEHLMEKFPLPRGMPSEWHEHEPKLIVAKKAESAAKKIEVKAVDDVEKEAHMMEAFPGLKTEPKHWHCTTCEDDK